MKAVTALIVVLLLQCVSGVDLMDKIKHIVVLMEENRSFDHLLGWYTGPNGEPKINGLNGTEFNYRNASDPAHSKKVFANKGAPYINYCDPNHGTPATTFKIFGPEGVKNKTNPTMSGFVEFEYDIDHSNVFCGVMDMFDTRKKLPVLTALADEFVLFDRLFASIPGPTWPNRQFFMSATSSGLTETFPWFQDVPGQLYPQKTIFDQVGEANASWAVYYEDTPWELFMESLAHNPEHLHSMDQFFDDARTGSLPAFSFLNPRSGINISTGLGSNDDHPDHDVALAELHYKNVYEALRNGPAWNETLFVLTFDEHGGFYDHVPTPLNVPPPTPGQKSFPDEFTFDRLGLRIPTLLISPWAKKGQVVSEPPAAQKPKPNSEYDLTSIIASSRKILKALNGTPPLTDRDAWVATWEHVLDELDTPRTDCPSQLPAAPTPTTPPTEEAARPVNHLQSDIMGVHAHLAGVPHPKHVTQQGQVSQWLQDRYEEHKAATLAWKDSKASANETFELLVSPFLTKKHPYAFHVNHHQHKMTLSIEIDKVEYCLDAAGRTNGSVLTISKCYPSKDPRTNRDKDQLWNFKRDATLRPYYDQTLCSDNQFFRSNETERHVYLAPCKEGVVTQHYAYHGEAPGNPFAGRVVFGDGTTTLMVYEKKK